MSIQGLPVSAGWCGSLFDIPSINFQRLGISDVVLAIQMLFKWEAIGSGSRVHGVPGLPLRQENFSDY